MKYYIAGHNGLVGGAMHKKLCEQGCNIITRTSKELDLRSQIGVEKFFSSEKPDVVILAAAKVGGIQANNTYPAQFIYDNLIIQANIIHNAYLNDVKKLLFLGSTCIYPRDVNQPIVEDMLLTGILEPTNEPYAIAKIAGIKLCESYNRQYGTDFRSIMPTNLYGPGDNFHLENAHVLPALMRKFHEAKLELRDEVTVWGSGTPRREFLYIDDMVDACLFVLGLDKSVVGENTKSTLSHINIGTGVDISITELAKTIARIVGYEGKILFDTTKPDGTPRKLVDVSKLQNIGWSSNINLEDGLTKTYDWFLRNKDQLRIKQF